MRIFWSYFSFFHLDERLSLYGPEFWIEHLLRATRFNWYSRARNWLLQERCLSIFILIYQHLHRISGLITGFFDTRNPGRCFWFRNGRKNFFWSLSTWKIYLVNSLILILCIHHVFTNNKYLQLYECSDGLVYFLCGLIITE